MEGWEDPTQISSLIPKACLLPPPAVSPGDFVISGDLQSDQVLLRLTCCHPLQTRLCQGAWGIVWELGVGQSR